VRASFTAHETPQPSAGRRTRSRSAARGVGLRLAACEGDELFVREVGEFLAGPRRAQSACLLTGSCPAKVVCDDGDTGRVTAAIDGLPMVA
jgi:hypothetical protein